MTYKNNFVVAIKTNDKILRESDSTVALPYNSEYAIRLKNLNSIKAKVNVIIDGEDVTSGWIVMQPNSSFDLERYIRNGNLLSGNKFKFIKMTDTIEKHRGLKEDDGLIRIEYKFEKIIQSWMPSYIWYNQPYPVIITNPFSSYQGNIQWTNSLQTYYTCCQTEPNNIGIATDTNNCCLNNNSDLGGITVPGSESNQQFFTTYDFECEESQVITLKLVGEINNTKVSKPITVDYKPKCITCGRINKIKNKFCSECGTALTII